jgi:hypothetical protein
MANARQIATPFPQLRARLKTAAADYGAAPENSFGFGLQAILDGLEAQLITRRTPADQNARKPPHHQEPAPPPLPSEPGAVMSYTLHHLLTPTTCSYRHRLVAFCGSLQGEDFGRWGGMRSGRSGCRKG